MLCDNFVATGGDEARKPKHQATRHHVLRLRCLARAILWLQHILKVICVYHAVIVDQSSALVISEDPDRVDHSKWWASRSVLGTGSSARPFPLCMRCGHGHTITICVGLATPINSGSVNKEKTCLSPNKANRAPKVHTSTLPVPLTRTSSYPLTYL